MTGREAWEVCASFLVLHLIVDHHVNLSARTSTGRPHVGTLVRYTSERHY